MNEEKTPWYRRIPGFRSGKRWKMVVASLFYLMLMNAVISGPDEETASDEEEVDNNTEEAEADNTEDETASNDEEEENEEAREENEEIEESDEEIEYSKEDIQNIESTIESRIDNDREDFGDEFYLHSFDYEENDNIIEAWVDNQHDPIIDDPQDVEEWSETFAWSIAEAITDPEELTYDVSLLLVTKIEEDEFLHWGTTYFDRDSNSYRFSEGPAMELIN